MEVVSLLLCLLNHVAASDSSMRAVHDEHTSTFHQADHVVPFPQWDELEEALHDMPLAEAYYSLPAGNASESSWQDTYDSICTNVGYHDSILGRQSMREPIGYYINDGIYEDLYEAESEDDRDLQTLQDSEDHSNITQGNVSHDIAEADLGFHTAAVRGKRDRKSYFREYYHKKKERYTPRWRWLVERRSDNIRKLIKTVAHYNKITERVARSRLEHQLTEQLETDLLSRESSIQKAALHLLDFKSPDELLSETEKVVFFTDYYRKDDGEVYGAPRQILRTAAHFLSDAEKAFVKGTIFKSPQDYKRIAIMIRKAVHEAKVQNWHKEKGARSDHDLEILTEV